MTPSWSRSRTRFRLPVVALALALSLAGVGWALETLRIAGDVVDDGGQPIAGAEIRLVPSVDGKPSGEGIPMSAKSNKKGKFTFAFAKPGEYQMSVSAPGGVVLTQVGIKIRDASRKPMTLADGTELKDMEGAVDPTAPSVTLGIPGGAFYVDLVLTLGTPPPASAAAPAADPSAVAAETSLKELGKARDDLLAGNFDLVVTEVDTVLGKPDTITDPRDVAIAHYMKGYALFKLGRMEEAQTALAAATASDPSMVEAYAMRGGILAEAGRYDEAAEAFRKALELNTDPARRPALLTNTGKALVESGKPDQAVPYLEEALALAPNDPDVIVNLADVYTRLGRADDAAKLINEGLPPKDAATLHFNIAAAMANSKDYAGAEQHFRQAIALDPTLVSAQRYLGDVLVAEEKRQEAIDAYEAYLAADPGADDAAEIQQMIDALKKSLPKSGGTKKK